MLKNQWVQWFFTGIQWFRQWFSSGSSGFSQGFSASGSGSPVGPMVFPRDPVVPPWVSRGSHCFSPSGSPVGLYQGFARGVQAAGATVERQRGTTESVGGAPLGESLGEAVRGRGLLAGSTTGESPGGTTESLG